MNEKLNYNEIEVGQSSKGVWYCKSIKVADSSVTFAAANIDDLISSMEDVLKAYNEPEKPEKKEDE